MALPIHPGQKQGSWQSRRQGGPNQQAYSFENSSFCASFQALAPLMNAWPPKIDRSVAGFGSWLLG